MANIRTHSLRSGAERSRNHFLSRFPHRLFRANQQGSVRELTHSPLTCWALSRAWGAIPPRALMPPAQAAPAAEPSDFAPRGPNALREQGNCLIQPFFAPV